MSRSSTTFDVTCPQCKSDLTVNEGQVGTRITCSNCLEEFVVARPARPDKPKATPPISPAASNHVATSKAGASDSIPVDEDLFDSGDDGPTALNPNDSDNWDDDRRQLDVLLKVENTSGGAPPASNAPYDFTVACMLCGTRLEAKSEQIGKKMQCPDCHSTFDIREPSRKSRRPRVPVVSESEELRLRDLDPGLPTKTDFRSNVEPISRNTSPTPPSTRDVPKRPSIMSVEDASRDTLARAQQELEQELKVQKTLPRNPMTAGVWRFLRDPTLILRIFFIAMAWWLEFGAIQAAVDLTQGGAIMQFASVMLRPFAVVFGLLLAANFASLLINLAQDTSNGRDDTESLPSVNPVEWFSESWQVFVSLFLTLALAGVVAQGAYMSSGSWTNAFMFGLVPAGLLLATVFPVILLSFLDNNTPYSSTVLRGLQAAANSWMVFTIQALGLAAIGIGLGVLRWNSTSSILNFGICIGLVLVAMLFFRLLGRLTWACQEKLSQEPAD